MTEPRRATIKDDDGRDYVVEDIEEFRRHLEEAHFAEGTIHVENGHAFTVDDRLRRIVDGLAGGEGAQ